MRRTDEATAGRNPVAINKTKNIYNDQPYKSIKNISYSISLQMINKNTILFYQNNMPKHRLYFKQHAFKKRVIKLYKLKIMMPCNTLQSITSKIQTITCCDATYIYTLDKYTVAVKRGEFQTVSRLP